MADCTETYNSAVRAIDGCSSEQHRMICDMLWYVACYGMWHAIYRAKDGNFVTSLLFGSKYASKI